MVGTIDGQTEYTKSAYRTSQNAWLNATSFEQYANISRRAAQITRILDTDLQQDMQVIRYGLNYIQRRT